MARQPINRPKPFTPSRGAFAARVFPSRNQYRNALAQKKGFANYSAQRRAPKPIRSEAMLRNLGPSEQLARHNALHALGLMRFDNLRIDKAAHIAHTRPQTVLRYAGAALTKDRRGKYVALREDRLLRTMMIPTPEGLVAVPVQRSVTASRIGRYWVAVARYRDYGDTSKLNEFRGKSFQAGGERYEFITDLATLNRLGDAGELHFEGPQSG